MALQMDPERRRKLIAADRARRTWQERHGITNPDWAEDHDPDRPGRPTVEQLAELERELRIIEERDPETGRYVEPVRDPAHLVARSSHEALLHLDLTPCPCGGRGAETTSVAVDVGGGGEVGRRYTRTCRACGVPREVVYRLPSVPYVAPGPLGFAYGPGPSRLIDAAQWLWVADHYARSVPLAARDLPPAEREQARGRLRAAVAALDEVLKFVPAGGSRVPDEAVWTPMGRAVRDGAGTALDPGRVSMLRASYLNSLAETAGRDEATGRSLGDPAAALQTYRELVSGILGDPERRQELSFVARFWARDHGVDDRDWTEEGRSGEDRRRPTPEQAWELVGKARRIVGRS